MGHLGEATDRPSLQEMVAFGIDYTFWLNIVFVLVAGALLLLLRGHRRSADESSSRRSA